MKTIFITGSTDGIGKLTALQLAKAKHQVIIHGRNAEKLERTISEIKKVANNTNIIGILGDFSNFESILTMTNQLKQDMSKIDVLINNAGVFKSNVNKTEKGFDIRFMVNYFAPFLLTRELLPVLNASESPRIINLSSAAQAPVDLEALQGNKEITVQHGYAQSKLALTMWSFYVATQYPSICTIAVNPGSLLNTKMVQEAYGQYWSSADKGAQILYDLSISEAYSKNSGEYFDNDSGAFSKAHPDAYNQEKIHQLFTITNSNINH